jgi:hypothetical protein
MGAEESYRLLLNKLDEFIRKYYINQLIRGLFITGSLLVAAYLVLTLSEYWLWFSVPVRTVLFWSFVVLAGFSFVKWIFVPGFHYLRLSKSISHEEAAQLIGKHFSSVQDRLLNVLQLKQQSNSAGDNSLIEASIQQKIDGLRPIPFTNAINLSLNRKYLKYLLPPAFLLLFLLIASPDVLRQSTQHLLNFESVYEKPAPFLFVIQNKSLSTIQYRDYVLEVHTPGSALPDEVAVMVNGFPMRMTEKSAGIFTYTFSQPQHDVPFYLQSGDFRSKDYQLEVFEKPNVLKFSVSLQYPAYTGRSNETIENTGDLTVPEGTVATWNFNAQNTSSLDVHFLNEKISASQKNTGIFSFRKSLLKDDSYAIYISNDHIKNADSIRYAVSVIPDQFPSIEVKQAQDSANRKYLYFAGNASDDYGLTKLLLQYRIYSSDSDKANSPLQNISVPFTSGKQTSFSEFWDINKLNLQPGQLADYYFEVWDNDGVHGPKSTKSDVMHFSQPSKEEFDKQTDLTNQQIENTLNQSINQAQSLQNDMQKMQQQILQKSELNWQDKKQMQDILDRQKKLEQNINQLNQDFNKSLNDQQLYKKYTPEMLQKQQQLQQLFSQLETPEMKDLMKKLQDLIEKLNKPQALDQLQNQQLSNQEMQKNMDRLLSLFKELQFEEKMKDVISQLDSLSTQQKNVQQQTQQQSSKQNDKKSDNKSEDNKNTDSKNTDSLKQQQQDVNQQFQDVQQKMDSLQKDNQQLDQPNQMPDTKQDQQNIEQSLQQSMDQLKKNNMNKASQQQQNASQQMQQMSQKLQNSFSDMQMQQAQEDLQTTRQILYNLIRLSQKQKDLLNQTKQTNAYNPKYLQLLKDQYNINDDLKTTEDSISKLSKKSFQLQSYVNKELTEIHKNLSEANTNLENRVPPAASSNQQYVMTDLNNLALLFEETLQQMQQQMMQMQGQGQPSMKNGQGQMNLHSLGQMQKQLNDKITQMQQQMQKGNQPGQSQGENGQQSEELAKLAAEQAAIRAALQQLGDQLDQQKKGLGGDLQNAQQMMNKTENDLVNKNLSQQTLQRQQQILNKLLSAENAEREKENDNKRQAEMARDTTSVSPPSLQEFIKQTQSEMNFYQTIPPDLQPFYRTLIENYFSTIHQ